MNVDDINVDAAIELNSPARSALIMPDSALVDSNDKVINEFNF